MDYNGGSPHFRWEPIAVGDVFDSLAKMIDDSDCEKVLQVDPNHQGAHVRKCNVVSRILFTYFLKDDATHD